MSVSSQYYSFLIHTPGGIGVTIVSRPASCFSDNRTSFPTRGAARRALFGYPEAFYDRRRRRRHSGLGFLTPAQAYEQMARAA
jgi:hypothetical protein